MRIHGITIALVAEHDKLFVWRQRSVSWYMSLHASDYHINRCRDGVSRVDRVRIRLDLGVEICPFDVSISLQVRAGRVSRLHSWSADDGIMAVRSPSICWGAVVGLARFGLDFIVAVPVSSFMGSNVVWGVPFHHDLLLEFFVDLAVLEERFHFGGRCLMRSSVPVGLVM